MIFWIHFGDSTIIIIIILYVDDIVNLAKICDDLDKHLKILHVNCCKMGMTVNTDKAKVMIIKYKKITHGSFVYYNHYLNEVSSYKYLGIDFPHQFNWNYRIEKRIIIMILKKIVIQSIFTFGVKKCSSLRLSSPLLSYTDVKFQVAIYLESWRKIEMIQKKFITYNLKIKGNTPILSSWSKWVCPPLKEQLCLYILCIKRIFITWNLIGSQKFLLTLVKTPPLCLKHRWHKDAQS